LFSIGTIEILMVHVVELWLVIFKGPGEMKSGMMPGRVKMGEDFIEKVTKMEK
tara:strand:- start:774 stop:932 length:159 start_codon:yes stop_codon:yes gene_type:complete